MFREESLPRASHAAARLLKEREEKLSGTVLLIFQESEESFAGAKAVVDSGVLKGATGVHGLHVWPSLQTGVLASRVSLPCPHGTCLYGNVAKSGKLALRK